MKINQVYSLFGSENLENFIYIQISCDQERIE